MKLSDLANELAKQIQAINPEYIKEVTAILSNKQMATYGRKLETGCVALYVRIETEAAEITDLGKMELFVPISKQHLKQKDNLLNMMGSVARFIESATEYRAEMIGAARERMTAQ